MSHIVGNIVGDVDLRYTPGGMAVAQFSVAENRREKVKGTYEDISHFFDVVVKFEQAEQVVESLQKGTRVVCVGEFTQRRWETKEGEKRSKIEFLAEEVAPSLRYATAVVTKKERPSKKVAEQYDERPF